MRSLWNTRDPHKPSQAAFVENATKFVLGPFSDFIFAKMAATLMDNYKWKASPVLTIMNGVETADFRDQRSRQVYKGTQTQKGKTILEKNHSTGIFQRDLPPVGFREVYSLMRRLQCSLALHSGVCSDKLPPLTTRKAANQPDSDCSRSDSQAKQECGGAFIECKQTQQSGSSTSRSRRTSSKLDRDRTEKEAKVKTSKYCRRVNRKKRRTLPAKIKAEKRYILATTEAEIRRVWR